jgi:hypothetical protein
LLENWILKLIYQCTVNVRIEDARDAWEREKMKF